LKLAVAVLLFASGSGRAHGQIYEWEDASGRHFANSLSAIPKEARSTARLTVKRNPTPESSSEPDTSPRAESAEKTQEEETTPFASGWDLGFQAGWDAATRAAAEEQPVCSAEPEVIVLQTQPPASFNLPRYDPTGSYYRTPYAGTVTVPFDGGRSRGLTLREQTQRLQGRY
jgi:hypothetical protein